MTIEQLLVSGPTIGEVSARVGLSPDTLRWYERIGLLEPIRRDGAGQRRYGPVDLDRLELLVKMRATGMPLAEMQQYVTLIREGVSTRPDRRRLLETHRDRTLAQIGALQRDLAVINRKIERYRGFEEC